LAIFWRFNIKAGIRTSLLFESAHAVQKDLTEENIEYDGNIGVKMISEMGKVVFDHKVPMRHSQERYKHPQHEPRYRQ
jgi:hypothetical protein